jgi:hypothetical protein
MPFGVAYRKKKKKTDVFRLLKNFRAASTAVPVVKTRSA